MDPILCWTMCYVEEPDHLHHGRLARRLDSDSLARSIEFALLPRVLLAARYTQHTVTITVARDLVCFLLAREIWLCIVLPAVGYDPALCLVVARTTRTFRVELPLLLRHYLHALTELLVVPEDQPGCIRAVNCPLEHLIVVPVIVPVVVVVDTDAAESVRFSVARTWFPSLSLFLVHLRVERRDLGCWLFVFVQFLRVHRSEVPDWRFCAPMPDRDSTDVVRVDVVVVVSSPVAKWPLRVQHGAMPHDVEVLHALPLHMLVVKHSEVRKPKFLGVLPRFVVDVLSGRFRSIVLDFLPVKSEVAWKVPINLFPKLEMDCEGMEWDYIYGFLLDMHHGTASFEDFGVRRKALASRDILPSKFRPRRRFDREDRKILLLRLRLLLDRMDRCSWCIFSFVSTEYNGGAEAGSSAPPSTMRGI